jgi:uncharacterized membrane protein
MRAGLWFIPGLFALGALLAAKVSIAADRALKPEGPRIGFVGDARNAEAFLSTLAGELLTFMALVFFITIVAMQLATSQLSPQLLSSFLRDRVTQVALGVYVATYVYCLVVLAGIEPAGGGRPEFVPSLSVGIALLLALACVGTFVLFVHHMTQSLRVINIIDRTADEGFAEIDHFHPPEPSPATTWEPPGEPDGVVFHEGRAGALAALEVDQLVAVARRHGCVLRIVPGIGDYVGPTYPLADVHGARPEAVADEVRRSFVLLPERNIEQDPAWAIRRLVDVAQRSLSPSVNDPSTAVQAMDRIEALLRVLVQRPLDQGVHVDEDGGVRLVVERPTWDGYVELAFTEIRRTGWDSLQVTRRLLAMCNRLLTVAPPERRAALKAESALIEEALVGWPADRDRDTARRADPGGMGVYRR